MPQSLETWERVQELFAAAVELPPSDRTALLTRECAGDQNLRKEVESLLASDERADEFIEEPAVRIPREFLVDEEKQMSARQFGAYRVIRELGRGGLGAVYLATRADEEYRKDVAIKVVKRGLDTDDILVRFRAERQILAQLDHSNIARLIDAGSTEDGVPYFVMEYVAGEPISSYCETHQLSTKERLELFRVVCSAVTYAHQHLVIHRDIKPSNILVTEDGQPKLLDFGIAKVLHADHALAVQTVTGARVMTPEYASPEQVRGLAISTSTDIYSLGVLLYELLTGQKPYRLTSRTSEEISRAVIQQTPRRPSTALENAAANRNSKIQNRKSLRGDLDNIVLMALRKEPERRYKSVEQFSEDIRRHLAGRPVLAHKDSVHYRAAKFIGRNKIGAIAAILVLLTSIGGIIATTWQAKRATEQRDQARRQMVKAERATQFLQNVLGFADPSWNSSNPSRNREATISQALTEAGRRAEIELADEPEVLAAVRHTIGSTYRTQSLYPEAEPHLRAALAIRRRVVGPQHPDTALSMIALAEWCILTGQYAEAEPLLRDAASVYRATGDEKWLAIALNDLGTLKWITGEYGAAERFLHEALHNSRNLVGPDRAPRAVMYSTLGLARRDQGDLAQGAEFLQKAIKQHRALPGEPRAELATALSSLASVVFLLGDYDRAESLAQEAFQLCGKTLGENHQYTAYPLIWLAEVYCQRGDYAKAMAEIERALQIQQRVLAAEHVDFGRTCTTLGKILMQTGDLKAAEAALRSSETLLRPLPRTHAHVATARSLLGECLLLQERHAEAEPLLVESHEVFATRFGARDPRTQQASTRLARLYEVWGQPEPAQLPQ